VAAWLIPGVNPMLTAAMLTAATASVAFGGLRWNMFGSFLVRPGVFGATSGQCDRFCPVLFRRNRKGKGRRMSVR
jgi:hypothetical protein